MNEASDIIKVQSYKEQAEELVLSYYNVIKIHSAGDDTIVNIRALGHAKQCAVISVNEKIKTMQYHQGVYVPTIAWVLNVGYASSLMQESCANHICELKKLLQEINSFTLS